MPKILDKASSNLLLDNDSSDSFISEFSISHSSIPNFAEAAPIESFLESSKSDSVSTRSIKSSPSLINRKSELSGNVLSEITKVVDSFSQGELNTKLYKKSLIDLYYKYDITETSPSSSIKKLELRQRDSFLVKELLNNLERKLDNYEKELNEYERNLSIRQDYLVAKAELLNRVQESLDSREGTLDELLQSIQQHSSSSNKMDKNLGSEVENDPQDLINAFYNEI